jgi:hypothetical protein
MVQNVAQNLIGLDRIVLKEMQRTFCGKVQPGNSAK